MELVGLMFISFLRYWIAKYEEGRKYVSKRDDFVVDALFYFEPVQRFEYRDDMLSFGSSTYCSSKEVLQ